MMRRCGSFLCWRRRCWVEVGMARREGRSLCSSPNSNANKALEPAAAAAEAEEAAGGGGAMTREEAYRRVHDLDFTTAARILFTAPPTKKKFGLDFHLVQLFFACMPSLAVYLVAQYARYEIRRMEAFCWIYIIQEVELKKQAEEEEKAKQAEEEAKAREKEMDTMRDERDPELVKVKVRLDALEETVKEIADETKKISHGNLMKDQKGEKKEPVPIAARDSNSQDNSNAKELARSPVKEIGSGSSPNTNVSPENVREANKVENRGAPS